MKTNTELRAEMRNVLTSDDIFDAFCLDHFPEIKGQFTIGMTRTSKENILLERVDKIALERYIRDSASFFLERCKEINTHDDISKDRKRATEFLWMAVLKLRESVPEILSALDYVMEAEYSEYIKTDKSKKQTQIITDSFISQKIFLHSDDINIEEFRPYLNDNLWHTFSSYRSFLGRACLVTSGRLGDGAPWYRDSLCLRLLCEALSSRHVEQLTSLPLGKFHFAQTSFEDDVLKRIRSKGP